jgi:hypothetical protein
VPDRAQFQMPEPRRFLSFGHCAASIVSVTDCEPRPEADPVVISEVKPHFSSSVAKTPTVITAELRENKNKSRDSMKDVFLKSTSFKRRRGQNNRLSCVRIKTVAAEVNSPSRSAASANTGNRKNDQDRLKQCVNQAPMQRVKNVVYNRIQERHCQLSL